MVLPYYQRLNENIKKSCMKYGVQVHYKGGLTIKNLLMAPKDKDHILKRVESYTDINVIRWSVMRNILVNQQEHLLKEFREHQKAPSPIFDHSNISGHDVTIDNFSIVERED